MLEHVLRRVQRASCVTATVLATTVLDEDSALDELATALGVPCLKGPVDDVLTRYAMAAARLEADHVVRVTADCPCIDPDVIDRVVRAHLDAAVDYTSNTRPRSFPHGLDVEVVSRSALALAAERARRREDREHVTSFIWSQPERFRIANVVAQPEETGPDIRVTLDTAEDYVMLQAVFDLMETDDFGARDIVRLIRRHPWLTALNAGVRQKLLPVQEPAETRLVRELTVAAEWALEQELPWAASVLLQASERAEGVVAEGQPDVGAMRERLRELRASLADLRSGELQAHA